MGSPVQTIRTWRVTSSAGGERSDGEGDGERLIDALSGASSFTVNKVIQDESQANAIQSFISTADRPSSLAPRPYLIYCLSWLSLGASRHWTLESVVSELPTHCISPVRV